MSYEIQIYEGRSIVLINTSKIILKLLLSIINYKKNSKK